MPTSHLSVAADNLIDNPDQEELRRLTGAMPNARLTEYGNYNIKTRVVARSVRSTFIVDDDPGAHSFPCIGLDEGERIAHLQDDYIKGREMVAIDGYIGNDADFRVPTRLLMEAANANVAAMQQILYFDPEPKPESPQLTVIYTPNLAVEGYPDERCIAVYLDQGVTRVCNSDYFGESKKGGLRMWNKIVYDRGGLALHAGCKVIPVDDRRVVGLVIGLSGTGKTTTTFTRQNHSLPVQDDFVALMPDGRVYASEDGCFAKTLGLGPEEQPDIYYASIKPDAYLENVAQNNGHLDFCDGSYTENGRSLFAMSSVEHAPAAELKSADFVLFLNRNDNIIPAVVKLQGAQAAAYFMLGETKGTAAGGAAEAGKFLRIPGTNPFFPTLHAQQGNRFLELLGTVGLDVYVMNTGRVGGDDSDERSRKVKIRHSSAIVQAIAEGTISWETDPDFGYQAATHVPGIDGEDELLQQPRRLYEKQGRSAEYRRLVAGVRQDRLDYLQQWPGLDTEIIEALS
ncbi:MAG: phosphoenolpyruvate carboxykinase [Acidobacteriota bacterium]